MDWKRSRGSQLIEFALVLPLLLILVFGIIDFSLALYDKAVVTNACREGARAGIVFAPVVSGVATGPLDANAIRDVVIAYAAAHLITFGSHTLTRSDVSVIGAQGASGSPLAVTVTYPYEHLVISRLIPSIGSITLSATTVMRME
jgi:Flp pilus assembly protein TadG